MSFIRAERVFILKRYFSYKLFPTGPEAFNNAYVDKELSNKATIHRMVTKLPDTEEVSFPVLMLFFVILF
jgi:hypothetical protein